MLTILKKELKSYFTSLFAYVYYGIYFFLTGIFFVVNCLTTYSTQFGYYVLSRSFLVMAAMIPFCTMQAFARERRDKTDQLLFTAPVSTFAILAGKYFATAIYVLLPVVLSVFYPVMIAMHGEMSVRFLVSSYIGVVLVSLVLLSFGMFFSSLTSNVVLSAVLCYAVYAVILLGRLVESILVNKESLYRIFHEISIYNKYYDLISGIVRSGDVLYLLLLAACFFFLTWFALESRRQSRERTAGRVVVTLAVVFALAAVFMSNTKVYDFTAERLLTLSEDTKEAVAAAKQPTEIYYMGLKSRANATYQEFLNTYEKLNDNITVHYMNVESDSEFRNQYLSDRAYVQEASLLVVCGGKSVFLDSDDYVVSTQTATYSYDRKLKLEEQLTRAIVYTNTEETDKLCMLVGHGETLLNSSFTNLLMLNNYEIEEVNLPEAMTAFEIRIPENSKAVFINAPQNDFTESELNVLRDYVKNGGQLVVTLDPLNEEIELFYKFLKEYGLEVVSGVVIEQDEGYYVEDTPYYLMPQIQDTEYTQEIIKDNLQVLTMTSKGIAKKGMANGYVCTDILTTSSHAFSKVSNFESDDVTAKTNEDIAGPFSVATCADNPQEGRVFLLASNVFFNGDADTESQGANRRFFVEILSKLTGTDSGVWIDGKDVGNQVGLYPNGMKTLLKIMTIVVIPAMILAFGILVIWIRRKSANRKGERIENE